MLLANNLSFKRSSKIIFHNLDIALASHKMIRIKGRNGIGKTTLIKILSNILIPTTGDIYWNGQNIKKGPHVLFKNLTYIMDTNTSKKNMTVNENIKFWIKIFSSTTSKETIESLLELLQISTYKNVMVKYLSSGEMRKLELCRLVIEQKKLWILDEPYMSLDESITTMLNETLKNHIISGGMIIFASHYNPQILDIEDIQLEDYAGN